ncbi:MAG: hypothetical protein Q4D58_04160 [Synergistaceae bacterium]|nr:hypothetical protein [Synergistaceae bacterium]
MRNVVRGHDSLSVVKVWICLLAAVALCLVSSASYASIINSNGTRRYVINGDHTWGLWNIQDEAISSLTVNDGSSLRLFLGEAEPGIYCIGNIYGDGNLEISGGGRLCGDYGIVGQEARLVSYNVYGLKSINSITLTASGILPGLFIFQAFPYDNTNSYRSVSLDRQILVVDNVRQSAQSDMESTFCATGGYMNKDISINGGVSMSLNSSDFASASLGGFSNGSLNIVGDSEISVVSSTVKNYSVSKQVGGVGAVIAGGASVSMYDSVAASTQTEILGDSKFVLKGQSRIIAKDVTVASEGTLEGYLGVNAAGPAIGTSKLWKAVSEVDSSYIEISGISFTGTGKHYLSVCGGGSAITYGGGEGINLVQSPGSAENKIRGASEIVIIGDAAFSGLRRGYVYCGGTVCGERASSTVGSALLIFKDIDARNIQESFSGVLSGQGWRTEYPTGDPLAPVTTDYTDSVLGDSVLMLDNVKADISSSDVNVKYFDEIILKNNSSVKMTTFDSDLKKVTVSGSWSSASGSVDALTFKEEVKNRDMIVVTVEADAVASGVTKAAWSDDGMRLIVYTAGSQPPTPSDGGSGGGCSAGCGVLAVFAFMGIPAVITAIKKFKRFV